MRVNIQTPGFKAQNQLLEFVQTNAEKLGVLSDRIIEIQVCLKIDNSSTRENKVCELRLLIAGNDLFSFRQTGSFEQSIIQACDAIRHQIEKWKIFHDKSRPRGRRTSLTAEVSFL